MKKIDSHDDLKVFISLSLIIFSIVLINTDDFFMKNYSIGFLNGLAWSIAFMPTIRNIKKIMED